MRLHGYHTRLRRLVLQVGEQRWADTCRCAPPFVRVEHRPPDQPDQPAAAAEAAPPDRCPRCGGAPVVSVIVERVSAARRPASGGAGEGDER